jgi:hypothetical protein
MPSLQSSFASAIKQYILIPAFVINKILVMVGLKFT